MLRILLFLLVLVHGLIHLLGFVKEWKLASVPQLGGPTLCTLSDTAAKTAGIGWLAAALLFVLTGVLIVTDRNAWWIPGAIALLLSQTLIILYWRDARFGTIANVILLLPAIAAYGSWNFQRMIDRECAAFTAHTASESRVVTREMIASLPPVVQRWFERTNMIGRTAIHTAHLHQTGAMRTKPDGGWMPVEAEQRFNADNPGFFWTAAVAAMPGMSMLARDRYDQGHGGMLIKICGLIPVVNSTGPTIDQGSMLRYLAECAWMPSAILHPSITWEQMDALRARATITLGGVTASGVFTFNDDGDMVSFDAKRYYDRPGGATLEDWHIDNDLSSIRIFDGIRIAARSTVTWKLAAGDFAWFRLEITDLVYR